MERFLLHCRRCDEIYGCLEPAEKECRHCRDHNCPLLPARRKQKGCCGSCKDGRPFRPLTFVQCLHSALSKVFPGLQGRAPAQEQVSVGAGAVPVAKPLGGARFSEATSWGGFPHWVDRRAGH